MTRKRRREESDSQSPSRRQRTAQQPSTGPLTFFPQDDSTLAASSVDPIISDISVKDGSLKLSDRQINDTQIPTILSFLEAHPEITTVDLRRNQIGDVGATAIAGNTTATTWNLGENQIGDAGATAIAGNTTATTWDLEGNQIGDVGKEAFNKPVAERKKRARKLGVKTEFPSLQQLCFFAIQKAGQSMDAVNKLKEAGMPDGSVFFQRHRNSNGELVDGVNSPKVMF